MRVIPTLAFLSALLGIAAPAGAQSQFSLVGPLEAFAVPGAAADPLRPGTIKVQGVTVVLPRNLLIQLPTSFRSAGQIAQDGPGGTESGLALADTLPPLAAFEANVVGNIVGGSYIAGLVSITQGAVAQGAGYVRRIDPATGEIIVGSAPSPTCVAAAVPDDPACVVAVTDAHLFLIDPNHRFTASAHRLPQDPSRAAAFYGRFTVDDENQSVRTETGFPVCLPPFEATRCPAANRPRDTSGVPLAMFVMDAAPLLAILPDGRGVPACPACDPRRQVPLLPGDRVIYAGLLAKDGTQTVVGAHALTANLGVFTRPGADPAYLAIETSLLGTAGGPNHTAGTTVVPQESQSRFRLEGFSTDPSRAVRVYAIDINPTDGSKVAPPRFLNVAPKVQGVVGRFRFIVGRGALIYRGTGGTVLGLTREVGVAFDDGKLLADASPTIANGLAPGRYIAPVGEFVFPENTVFGDFVVPANFECLAFLQRGVGPLGGAGGPLTGRLAPWPGGPSSPAAVTCTGAP